MIRRAHRRRLGVGLLAFGATGIVLVAAAVALVLGSLSAVDDAATGFERQRAEAVALLGPARDALDHAATSASNASGSLIQASTAADQAAQLTTRLANSFDGLASLGSFELFGARPFASMSAQFTAVAADSRALSVDLAATAGSLRANVSDGEAVAADLRSLALQLDRLETSLGGPPTGSTAASASLPIATARIVLLGLLAWMAAPALACLWLGWSLALPKLVTARRRENAD